MASGLVIIQMGYILNTVFFVFRYLAPSFLASLGAVGFVGYAFAQTKAVPSSPNVSFLHLVGVAGKHFLIIYSKYIFQTTF